MLEYINYKEQGELKMRKRILLNLSAIIVGMLMCLNFAGVQAAEFTETNITRDNLKAVAENNTVASAMTSRVLGISKNRKSGSYYQWNPTSTNNAKTVWKIATIQSGSRNYDDLYYCLNAAQGFGLSSGDMAEGARDTYNVSYDMKEASDQSNIINASGSTSLGSNYNKVLWILDHSYIPTNSSSYKSSNAYKTLMKNAGISIENKEWDLTEDDIEVVQQMAIWYFTNSNTAGYHYANLPSLYVNGKQLSSIYYGTTEDGEQMTGAERQAKAEELYQYFLKKASASYTAEVPSLTLSNSGAKVEESGNYYIAGPFTLSGENTSLIQSVTGTVTPNKNYTLLDGNKKAISGNDFSEVVGDTFYLRFNQNDITEDTDITIKIDYTYSIRTLTFMTNTAGTPQPVVLVKEETLTKATETNIRIEIPEEPPVPEEVTPDLALRKYITSVNGTVIQSGDENYRVPQIDTAKLDNETATTARYVHKKNPIEINPGDTVVYNITVYNEGETEARASQITDQLPTGLQYNRILTNGYTGSYEESTNRLVITKTGTNNLAAYTKNGTPASETVQVECTVTANKGTADEILTNIAWISEMKDKDNNTFTADRDSQTTTNPNYNKDNMAGYEGNGNDNGYYQGQQDDDDFDRLIIKGEEPAELDFALRKFITKVNDTTIDRTPKVDTSTIATTGTATYKHEKEAVAVKVGDIVTYTIRVYNEGEANGYVSEITDHLPQWLDFLPEDELNQKYLWQQDTNARTIKTQVAAKDSATGESIYANRPNKQLLAAYHEGNTDLDYIDVEIRCKVNNKVTAKQILTNIADITGMQEEDGTEVTTDRDSTKDNVTLPSDSDLPNYKGNESNKDDLTDENYYYKGQEDDDDFEKLVVEIFDLALKKFAIVLNDDDIVNKDGQYIREPKVDASKLGATDENGNLITNATYTMPKTPIQVKKGDIITYVLRVYNEGSIDGFANEVIDYIPAGLKFIEASSINKEYGWTVDGDNIKTTYLSEANSSNVIKAVAQDESGNKVLDYKDLQVQFEIVADPTEYAGKTITNWAEVGEDSNNDIDSTPGNNNKNEDDIDYEPVELTYFDLALRKFITKVNSTDYNNREPKVDTSKLGTADGSGKKVTTATYTHTKDPVTVETGNTVEYTIRVYNEGTRAGYANEITDNIPAGLEFLPSNETNKTYNWVMLDAQGKVTSDVKKAVKITTDYLSESKGTSNIIAAYRSGSETLAYKDVKVAFKVTAPNTSNKVVVNTAEVSKASDEDIDSTPGNNKDQEDDLDKEYLKVRAFDLALKKWVTATKIIYNGRTTTKNTGFNENSTEMAKVDLVGKKLKNTTVKFVYNIKVINEGEVAGYAYEVKDYIPEGLKFVSADNPKWKLQSDGTATTDQLKDKLLQPGESAVVEIVLTWKKSTTNMGVKTNWAEISKDSGDDIDSTPNNNNKSEDDIDDASVILSIKTGSTKVYITLALASVAILAAGTVVIKKKVLVNE